MEPNKYISRTAKFEGFEPSVYLDTEGKRTIGYGFNLDEPFVRKHLQKAGYNINSLISGKQKLTEKESKVILNDLYNKAFESAKTVVKNFQDLPENAQHILADMSYNMGAPKLRGFKKMIKALENQDFRTAATELKDSKYYTQTKNRGETLYNELLTTTPRPKVQAQPQAAPQVIEEPSLYNKIRTGFSLVAPLVPGGVLLDKVLPYAQGGEVDKYKSIPRTGLRYPKIVTIPPDQRSNYDPTDETIYLAKGEDPTVLQHEMFHHWQNLNNNLSVGPVNKPPMMSANPGSFYNRRQADIQDVSSKFLKKNPSFINVPFNLLYDKEVEPAMYYYPEYGEGEAEEYQNYIKAGGEPVFPTKRNGGPVYNWIPPNYPRVGARNAQGGWLDTYDNGGTVEDQKIPDTTAYEFGNKFIAYPDKTLTNYQMGTPKSKLPNGKIVDATPEIPAYAHGATVWTKQTTPSWVAGTPTPTTTQREINPSRTHSPGTAVPYPEIKITGPTDPYSPSSNVLKGYNPYNGPMRLHAPDTTIIARNGGYVPAYKSGGFLRQAGEFAFGALEGTLDTVTGGMTDSLTDMAHDALADAAGTTYDDKAGQRLKRLHGAGKIGGAITGAIVSGNVAGAIGQGAEGTNDILQYSPNASEDLKKWGGFGLNLAQQATGFMGGMNNTGQMAKFNASDIGKFAGQAGKAGQGLNMFQSGNVMGMMNMFQPQGMGSLKHGGRITAKYNPPGLRYQQLNPGVSAPEGIYTGPTTQRGITFEDGGDVELLELKPSILGGASMNYQKGVYELPMMGGNISGNLGGRYNPYFKGQAGLGNVRSAIISGEAGVAPHIKAGKFIMNPSAAIGLTGGIKRRQDIYTTDPSGNITQQTTDPTLAGNIYSKAKVKAAYTGLPKNYEFDPYMSAEVIKDPYGTRLPISAGLDFGRDTFVQGSYDPLSNTFGIGAQFNFGGEKNPYKYKGKAKQPKVTPTTRTFADGGWLNKYDEGSKVVIGKPYLNPATVQATLALADKPVTNTLGRVISTSASREKERREKIIAKDQSKYSVEDYKKGIQEPGAGNSILDDPLGMAIIATATGGAGLGSKAIGTTAKSLGRNLASEATLGATDLGRVLTESGSLLQEALGEVLKGRSNKRAIQKGNAWLENWIKNPTTQAKIDQDLPAVSSNLYPGLITSGVTGKGYSKNQLLKIIENQSKNFKPISTEYSLSNQLVKPIHVGNSGISYVHNWHPILRDEIERGLINTETGENMFGSYISRSPFLSESNRIGTVVHEGTHDWVPDFTLKASGQSDYVLHHMPEDIRNNFFEWKKLREAGKSMEEINKIMGHHKSYQGYMSDPTEMHARIMELRQHFGLKPEDTITPDDAAAMVDEITKMPIYKQPINLGYFYNVIEQDPKKLANLFNRLWMAPPAVAVGAQAIQQDNNKKSSGGWLDNL